MKFHSLDGLRGLFSIMVVLFHVDMIYIPNGLFQQYWIRESYVLVDFFFLLSGFVISLHYTNKINKGTDLLRFMHKRFKRIYPLLLFTSIIFFLFICTNRFTSISPIETLNFLQQEKINILETLLLSNATPILGTGFGINYPSWTVSGEMFAYLIFALICLSATPLRKRNLIIVTLIVCFLFMLFTKTYFYNFSWGVVRGLFCFLLGYGVTKSLSLKLELPKWIDLLILPLIFLLMYVLHQFDPNAAGKQLFALFAVPITFASIMIIMTRSQGNFNKLMEHAIFQFLGSISYSTYLNHALIITYIPWLVFHKMHWTSTPAHQWIILASCMIVLVGYSYLTYRLVERQGVRR